jgi:2-C-methyl-D-erythritol 4-phosphate cytidylyltransferase
MTGHEPTRQSGSTATIGMVHPMSVAVIVLAGGSGARIGREVNKVFLPLGKRVTLGYSLATMDRASLVDEVVLVVRDEDRTAAEAVVTGCSATKPPTIVTGGMSRHQSELAGLEAIAPAIEAGQIELVAIHDGARPFASLPLLQAVLEAASAHGGAVPALPIGERLYRKAGDRLVLLASDSLRRVQTPQAFRAGPLLAAYRMASAAGFEGIDTAETVQRFAGTVIATVPGDPRNIKVTFVEDFFTAEDLALRWEDGVWTDRPR